VYINSIFPNTTRQRLVMDWYCSLPYIYNKLYCLKTLCMSPIENQSHNTPVLWLLLLSSWCCCCCCCCVQYVMHKYYTLDKLVRSVGYR